MSVGYLQSTEISRGFIIPKLLYKKRQTRSLVKNYEVETLDAKDLSNFLEDKSKIITELNHEIVKHPNNQQISVGMVNPVTYVDTPFLPRYHPTKIVPEVWNIAYHPATFESIVYPPNYIDV